MSTVSQSFTCHPEKLIQKTETASRRRQASVHEFPRASLRVAIPATSQSAISIVLRAKPDPTQIAAPDAATCDHLVESCRLASRGWAWAAD